MSYANDHHSQPKETIRSNLRARDVGVLVLVPAVLTLLFFIPVSLRESLAVDYTNPTALTAFMNAFVHLSLTHLSSNLIGYLLIVPIAYTLSAICDYRQRFYASFVTFVLLFPLALTVSQFPFVDAGIGLGFSGIVMAFYGYLPLAISDLVAERFGIDTQTNVAPLLFFLGFGIITVLSVSPVLGRTTAVLMATGVLTAVVVMLSWYAMSIRTATTGFRAMLSDMWNVAGYFELFAASVAVFLVFPFAMFPTELTSGMTIVNTYTHMMGYSLGFTVTYAASHLSPLVAAESSEHWI
jgi:hypothetical protein